MLYIVLSIVIGMNDNVLIKEGFYFFWKKGVYTFYQNMKTWGLIGLIIISIQFIVDNIQILGLKRKVNSKNEEIVQLKAKLFDQREPEKASQSLPSGEPDSSASTSDEVTTDKS